MKKIKIDWAQHVAAIKSQGISTSAYAKQHGLARSTLYSWQSKLKTNSTTPTPAPPVERPVALKPPSKFVTLRLREPAHISPPAPTPCTLVLSGGIRLEMPAPPDPRWLADVARYAQGEH